MNKKKRPNFFSTIEMCILLITIGTSFTIIGLLHILEKIIVTSSLVSSLAISGLLFVIADFFNYPLKLLKNSTDKKRFLKISFNLVRIIFLIASILSLTILPYILSPTETLDKIAVGLSIITIGFTIINISLNYYFQSSEIIEYIFSIAERAVTRAEESTEHAEKAITIAENLIEQNKEKI
ncbi:hypothetical protein JOC25_001000 [Solibacillus kalamii]|uniref:Uncharacterized protein n=1 Tax=Solibacillus kalamii TaxID=1748298 RepID=A0ABX3ZIZ1_9BACL|nr:hypothetical protein [Solibacillus kalamii]MBM7664544.1 hypothetical protein [Solibacillus kalamii]OUZ39707.1 hypothetical protein CBM15_04145 [Solibacillus kalamii]